MSVIFKEVSDFPGYRVGDDGSVWTCWAKRGTYRRGCESYLSEMWKQLKPGLTSNGYHKVSLRRSGRYKGFSVHVLVLTTFNGPPPCGMQCAHENGIGTDNRLANLSWKTPKENSADKRRHGTHQNGERHGQAKLSTSQVLEVFNLRENGLTLKDIGSRFGVGATTIHAILNGTNW